MQSREVGSMSLEAILTVLVLLVVFGWIPVLVLAVVRGRRPRSSYGRQLRAAERGRHRRRRRRGDNGPGITINLDARGPGAPRQGP